MAVTPRWSRCRQAAGCWRRSSPRSMARTSRGGSPSPKQVRAEFERTPDLVAIDDRPADAPRVLHVLQSKAALLASASARSSTRYAWGWPATT